MKTFTIILWMLIICILIYRLLREIKEDRRKKEYEETTYCMDDRTQSWD